MRVIDEKKAIGDEHCAWRIATLYNTPSRRRHEIRFVIVYIRMRLRAYTR